MAKLDYVQIMGISWLNMSYSCSTLVLHDFSHFENKEIDYDFIKNLKHCMRKDFVPNYAHVFASTTANQLRTQKWFRKLGFIESPAQYNEKNKTVCTLFMIPVPTLLEKLKEYPDV